MPSDADESPSLLERITRWRNRLIATPEAQRWFFRLPLVRAIAQRRSRALFDLCAGFVYSQILDACVRLDIFAHLRDSPRTVETIAARAHLDFDSARRLLKAAAAIGLVRPLSGDRFALADLGAAVLGNPGLSEMIAHHTLFYEDLRDPVALLRAGAGERLSQFWAYTTEQRNEHALYSDLMAKSQAFLAEDVLDAYAFPDRTRLMDVGGGEGVFLRAASLRAPHLRLSLFDLPPVVARAQSAFARSGFQGAIDLIEGDFLSDELPQGADAISLIRVLHDHDDEPAADLLRRVHDALPQGGILLLAEPMSGVSGAEPVGDAYFGFYLLAMGRGRPRTRAEIEALLRTAGFASVRHLRTLRPAVVTALLAIKA